MTQAALAKRLGLSPSAVGMYEQGRREPSAQTLVDLARELGVVMLRKGHRTLITDGCDCWENHTGNPGMATGGSGDVLAGVIGALVAQGMDPYYAAMCGVYLHGAAGDGAAARLSQHSMLPTDLIEELPNLFLQFEK